MQTSLQQVLSDWEGKKVDMLKRAYQKYHDQPFFVEEILSSLNSEAEQKAASWLLKHHLEQAYSLSSKEILTLTHHLQHISGWESRRHLLQILPLIDIPKEAQLAVEDFVRESLPSDNKFVRAWAIQGMYELSRQRPELQKEVYFLCEKAMQTEAASVKARVRKILAHLEKQ
ncbi:hypothetical protein OKW21_000140 [Catalinimonas alkaloidigena]|uniref:hypothetical protein n=1 Tax=Catalinimonas alkaloidigena TaxID=1075417 RepID=UPI00240630E1|nr:hypothetical protein [Catalinimonas alkaloidigena]MDF9794877.1 hypothetical protein [Catalinimonas alkaloidigena]